MYNPNMVNIVNSKDTITTSTSVSQLEFLLIHSKIRPTCLIKYSVLDLKKNQELCLNVLIYKINKWTTRWSRSVLKHRYQELRTSTQEKEHCSLINKLLSNETHQVLPSIILQYKLLWPFKSTTSITIGE